MTEDDKKNYVKNIEQADAYSKELSATLNGIDKKKDVPVAVNDVFKYTNKFETVSFCLTSGTMQDFEQAKAKTKGRT